MEPLRKLEKNSSVSPLFTLWQHLWENHKIIATEDELWQIVEFVRKLDYGHTRYERFSRWFREHWNYHVFSLDDCGRIILEKAKLWQLERELKKCKDLWGKYSCDSFGYYIEAIRKRITEIKKEKERNNWARRFLSRKPQFK